MTKNEKFYAIVAPGKNANILVKSTNKEGVLRCCELMNELEPGELGVAKFVIITFGGEKLILSEAVSNGAQGQYE